MANQRALVIVDGAQRRLPAADKLDVGSGIVGYDSSTGTLNAELALGDSSQEVKILGNMFIEGKLNVKGDTALVETLVTQTIFQDSVQFGDQATDLANFRGIADFDGSIDADVSTIDMDAESDVAIAIRSNGANDQALFESILSRNYDDLDAANAAVDASDPGDFSAGDLAFFRDTADFHKWDGTAWVVASAADLLAKSARLQLVGGATALLHGLDGVSLQDSVGTLKLNGSGALTDEGDRLASIDLQPSGTMVFAGVGASSFKTHSGNLTVSSSSTQFPVSASRGEAVFSGTSATLRAINPLGVGGNNAYLQLQFGDTSTLAADPNQALDILSGEQMQLRVEDSADNLKFAHLILDHDAQSELYSASGQKLALLAVEADLDLSSSGAGLIRVASGQEILLATGNSKHIILGSDENFNPAVAGAGHARIRNVADPDADQDVVTKKYMEENGGGTIKLTLAEHVESDSVVSLNASGFVQLAEADVAARHYVVGLLQKIDDASYKGSVADATALAAVPSPDTGDKYYVVADSKFQKYDGSAWVDLASDAERPQGLVRMLGKFTLAGGNHAITPGAPIYMSVTAGEFLASAPSGTGDMVQRVGFALGGADIMVMIGEPVIL